MNKLFLKIISILIMCCVSLSLSITAFSSNSISNENLNQTNFIPDNLLAKTQRNITREEYCSVIVNFYQYITKEIVELPADNPFSDTDNVDVLKAYNLGIVNGVSKQEFDSKADITVEQEAKMLYYTLLKIQPGIDDSIIHDCELLDASKISPWAVEAIEYLYHHNIITNDVDNDLNPKSTVSIEKANLKLQNAFVNYKNILKNDILSKGSPLVTCTAYGTIIAMPYGYKKIEEFIIGDAVLSADMSLKWSSNTIKFSQGVNSVSNTMVYIQYGDNKYLIVTPDQLFMLADKKLKRANNIIAGKDFLIDKDGNPVSINLVSIGMFKGGIHHIATDTKFNGNPDNHLLIANGVVVGDFTLQIHANELDKKYLADNKNSNSHMIIN